MKPKTLLIADDDAMLVRVLSLRCKNMGLEVQSAPDAMYALFLSHKHPPDAILLDIHMPAGNGLAVCEMLASDARLSQIPVIVMTGQSDEDTLKRCEALGAYYLCKSTDLWNKLQELLCELLGVKPNTVEIGVEDLSLCLSRRR